MKAVIVRAGLRAILVLPLTLIFLAVILGLTGFADKMLGSVINEELRNLRTSLAQTIRDPEELDRVMEIKKQELVELYNLDQPWYYRLPDTIKRTVTLDLGCAKTLRAANGSCKIKDIVLERLPRTLILTAPTFVSVSAIGIFVGIWLATKSGTMLDRIILAYSVLSLGFPAWWIGMNLIFLFSVVWPIFPSGGMYSLPPPEGFLSKTKDLAWHAVLPVTTLTLASLGPYLYTIRNMTLQTAREDFVVFNQAKGFSSLKLRWHILRVAMPRIVTGFILGLAGLVTGSVLTEIVFRWPGMGLLYYQAVLGTPDEGLIIALTFLFTLLYVLARFILEILYVLLDPRIRGR